jgi:hypothetical protein
LTAGVKPVNIARGTGFSRNEAGAGNPTMIELLALPDWQTGPTTVEAWVTQLSALGAKVVVTRESPGVAWLEVAALRLRGYAVMDGSRVEAINFELAAPDPSPAAAVVESVAQALGWEVHPDEPDDEQDDE